MTFRDAQNIPNEYRIYDNFLKSLRQEYAGFQNRFSARLLGVIQIGSFAFNEFVPTSDHDFRLIIHCREPLLILDERPWIEVENLTVTHMDWQKINLLQITSFGLTNLAFVEQMLEKGRYSLIDLTCLYQGIILLDATWMITNFRIMCQGVRFPNIVSDYFRQIGWRVTNLLLPVS